MDIDKCRNSILVIGAGGVGSAFVRKALQYPNWFTPLHLASRSIDKCQILKDEFGSLLAIHQLDADDSEQVFELIQRINATLVVNLALPYQDLSIMDACLRARVDYIDTANYEPIDEAKFCYKWQWDYRERFEETGNMAILGTGFDPGVTNVFCQYANTHLFDTLHTVDIVDCNAGDHGHPFATNFNPEINIREITQNGKYYHQGQWIEVDSLSESMEIDFPEVGPRKAYLIYHEELESLVKNIPEIQTMRFWMTFSDAYLTHLEVLQNVGLTSIEPMSFQGQDVVPLQFLKACLPDPGALGSNYTGKTSIGCLFKGLQGGKEKAVSIYNVCDHEQCYKDIKAHAVSFTTAIPALITTKLIRTGIWKKPGVFNIEEFDPDPFMKEMPNFGLQWEVREDV
jgi:saccharopine dehydrogenase (NAD+, L-lysine-forming)